MNNDTATALSTLRLDPDDKQALGVLAALRPQDLAEDERGLVRSQLGIEFFFHIENENLDLLFVLLDLQLSLETDPAVRAGLLVDKAGLLFTGRLQPVPAVEVVKEALAIVPDHQAGGALLREIEDELGHWQDRAEMLSSQAAEATDKSVAAANFATEGEILLRHRDLPDEAEAMLKRALALDPQNKRADLLLERMYTRAGRQDALADHYVRRIEAASGPVEKSAALICAGRLAEKMGKGDEAMGYHKQALNVNPGDDRAIYFVGKMLGRPDDLDELIKVYEAALKSAKRGPAEAKVALALGEIVWKRRQKLDEAEPYFRRARKALPHHPKVVEFYRDYHLSRDELAQVLTLLMQAQKAEQDTERRIRYGIDLAELAERKPQFIEKAIDAWKQLLRIRPGLPAATTALRRLFTKAEKWNALLELLKDQCESLPSSEVDQKVERYLEMVPIYRDRLKLEVMVINTYAAILGLKPDHAVAMGALAELYEAQGRWGDLAGVRTRQAQAATDLGQKVTLYHRVAALWIEKFGNHHNAISALEKVIEVAPADEKARQMLRAIYTRGRSWRALLELYRRELPLLSEDSKRDQLAQMAILAAERLADLRQAIGLWNEVLEAAPSDRPAATALVGLYEREKRWPALVEILSRLAESAGGEKTPEGCALLERRGIILIDKLGAGQAAMSDLRRVNSAQPDNPRVLRALREAYAQNGDLDALESLYATRGAWDELCDVLSGLADRTADMRLRTRALERVASVAGTKLNQIERVLKAYEGILATSPDARHIARSAAELYKRTERYGRFVATLEVLLGPESAPALSANESLPILAEAREVCETKMEAKGLAFKWCARAYRLAPTDTRVRDDLFRLAKVAEEWDFLLALLVERQGMAGTDGPDPGERLFILRECLNLVTNRIYRPADVQRFAETILGEVPGDADAEAALISLFTTQERWKELVALQHTRVGRMSDPAQISETLLRTAHIEEDRLNEGQSAAASLQLALKTDPENLRVLKELCRVLQGLADHRSLVAVLSQLVSLVEPADRADVYLRLGQINERELGDFALASRSYLQTLDIDNINAESVQGLERMLDQDVIRPEDQHAVAKHLAPYYELTENYGKWASTLEYLLKVETSEAEKLATLEILGDLYAGPLGDTVSAYGAVLRLFECDPKRPSVREHLVQLGELVGKLQDIAGTANRLLDVTDDPSLRLDLLMLVADVEERQPSRLSDAEAALREVLKLEPLHTGAYKTLCRFCKEADRWGALRDLVMSREQHLPDLRSRLELLWQAIEIDEGLLYDRPHASATLRKIIELVPDDLRAYRILEKHYADAKKWRELDTLLASEMPLLGKTELSDLKLRRADLALTHFKEFPVALHFIVEVLDVSPSHAQIIPLLERCLAEPEVRQRAAGILEPLLANGGQWVRLVEILEIEAEGHEGLAQVELLARKAELQETKLGEPGFAFDTWRGILTKDPTSARALSESERLGGLLGRHQDLVDMYDALVKTRAPSDLSGIADLLTRAARLCMAHVPDRKSAISAWRRVLDLDPASEDIGGAAATALESLYAEVGDIPGLIHILRCRSGWSQDPGERGLLLLRVADLEEIHLGDLDKATATYQGLLDSPDEVSSKAFDRLDRIYQQGNNPAERAMLLKRRLDHMDAEVRLTLRFQIATIVEKELNDLDDAIATLRPILDDHPGNRDALVTLARLYEAKGAAADRLDILERLLAISTTDGEKRGLLAAIAKLLVGPLDRAADALERWREILRINPTDAETILALEGLLASGDLGLRQAAAETLEPLYTVGGEAQKLADLLVIFIALAGDAHSRAEKRARLAEIQEKQLNDRAGAFKTWAATIRDATSDPDLDRVLDSYERLATALGPDTVLDILDLYREIEPDVLADTTRMRIQKAVAHHAIKLGDFPVAVDYLNRLVERRPEDDQALFSLESIFRQQGEWQSLYGVILRRADLAQNPKSELALRREAGMLAAKLEHKEDAITAWERVFALKPGDADAVAALDTLYSALHRWDDLTNLIERRLGLGVSAGDAIDLRFRLAEIERVELLNRHKALSYLEQVLGAEPNHTQAIAILQEMLADPEVGVEAANLLEPVYIRRNAWKELVGIDSLRLKFSEDPELRLSWTQRIAQVYEEQIEDLDEAFNWYGRVFQEKPTDPAAQEQLLRLAPKQNRWADLGKLLDEYLDNDMSNTDDVLALVRMAIRVYDKELNDRDSARRHYRRYVEAQIGDRDASALYEDALERWEAWAELRDLLDEQSRLVDSQDLRAELLRRSALLSDEKLSEAGAAIDAMRTVLEIHPADLDAAMFLDQLLTQEGRYEDLRDHLVWMLSRADQGQSKDALTLELAKVEGEHLGNVSGAVEYYGEILARTPNHAEAIAALESILSKPDYRARVAELLEPAYRTIRDLPKLAAVLGIRLETLDDSTHRVVALREIATIESHLGRPAHALEARGSAWLEDVTNASTLVELETQAAACSGFGRLVELIEKGAADAMDPELRGDLHAFRANVLEARLGDPEKAMAAWREAIEARPDHLDSFLALERLLADANKIAELCEVLEKHAEVSLDAREREGLIKRVATLFEYPLEQRGKAISAWRTVLDMDQNDHEALDALVRLYLSAEDHTSLVEILLRKMDTCHDPDLLRSLRFQAAEVYDEKLSEPTEAATQLRAILADHPDDGDALEMLSALCLREKQFVELVEVLDKRAKLAKTAAERLSLAYQAAHINEHELLNLADSVERYRLILAENPAHPETCVALWALAKGEDNRVAAIDVLEPVLRMAQEWKPLCELLELRLSAVDLPAERMQALAAIALVQERFLGDIHGAFATFARALAEVPDNDELRGAVERLANQAGDFHGLAAVYEDRLKNSYDVSLQKLYGSRLAVLCEGVLANPARAVELWGEVATLPGAEEDALAHQEALLRQLGRSAELAEVLQREADIALSPGKQADFWAELGLVLLGAGDPMVGLSDEQDRAIQAFRSSLDRNPLQAKALKALRSLAERKSPPADALDILEPLAEERGDFAEMVSLTEARVSIVDDPVEKASLLRRIADLCDTRLNDKSRALDALGRALFEDPAADETAEGLARLAEDMGTPVEAARRIAKVLPGVEPALFPALAMRAANLFLAATGQENQAAALDLYTKVLESDPENTEALEAVESIYRKLGDYPRLAGILERRGEIELSPERRLTFFAEAARLHEAGGHMKEAVTAWQKSREGDESNPTPLDELARLFESLCDYPALVDILREKAQIEDNSDTRADLFVRVAELQAGPIEDQSAAVDTLKEALDYAPNHLIALATLVELEEMRGDYTALEEALLRQSNNLQGEEQFTALARLARNASTHLNDPERALVYLQQILAGDPSNRLAFGESERLLTSLERWHELIDLLERLAGVEAAGGNAAGELACQVKIASLWGEKLGAEENALEALGAVLAKHPQHCPSLLAVARIHMAAERWDEASAVLEKVATVATSREDKADFFYRQARIKEATGSGLEEVIPLFQAALTHEPAYAPALSALEEIGRKYNQPALLSTVLSARLTQEKDLAKQKPMLVELTTLLLGPLNSPAEAIPLLDRLRALSPDDLKIQENQSSALIASGRVDEGEFAMGQLIEALTKARKMKDVARLQCVLGGFALGRGDLGLAQQRYASAYQIDPTQGVVLGSLARLSLRQKDAEGSRRYLRTLLLQTFDEKAAGITKSEVYLELGRLHAAAGENAKARNMFERGLESDPRNEALKQALTETPR